MLNTENTSFLQQIEDTFQTNLFGAVGLCKYIIPHMMERKWGRIIGATSIATSLHEQGVSCYSASKAGLESLVKGIAIEYGRFGITANSLSLSHFNAGLINSVKKEVVDSKVKTTARRRSVNENDILSAVDFLCKNDFITGETLRLHGGL